MSITVVGTVAFDAIQTPFGKVDRCLGGSATYFSVAASFFSRVNLVAVVGDDFTDDDASIFAGRDINLDGLQRVAGAKSFFWSGEYGFDLNVAKTRETQLNVFENFKPRLNEEQRRAKILFLANTYRKGARVPAAINHQTPRTEAGGRVGATSGSRQSSSRGGSSHFHHHTHKDATGHERCNGPTRIATSCGTAARGRSLDRRK